LNKRFNLVAISAGSRFEVYYPPGTAHFVEKLSFSVKFKLKIFLIAVFSQRRILKTKLKHLNFWKDAAL
jgi:hypothetical protein